MNKSILSTFVMLFIFGISTQAQEIKSAKEIIDKHLEITGGAKNWEKLNTIILKGRVALDVDQVFDMNIYHKRPFMKKVVFVINGKEVLNDGYDGKNGYTYNELVKKNVVVPNYQPEAFDSDLLTYKKKGFEEKLAGSEEINGIDCYKVTLTKNKNITTYYFSKDDFELIAEENKEEMLFYSNFKKVKGLTFAFSIIGQPKGGGEYSVNFDHIQINPVIDDKMFVF